ncbi:MAG: hypothetical protein J7L57_04615 [Deltaproteobacteria bacterium]|nr:hypothetical protein [Candidatus Tharpella sp.]
MNTISGLVPKQLDSGALSGNPQPENSYSSLALKAARVTAATSLSKDITIETAEGDKVTLSYRNDTSFQAASYDAFYQKNSLVNGENGELMDQRIVQSHTDLFAYSQESQISFSVEGDLNEQERKDIREALKLIDKMMIDSLQGGDLLQGAQDAVEIIELESIAVVDADYRYQSLVTIEEMTQFEALSNYGDSGALEDDISSLELPERSSSMDQVQELIDRMAEFIEEWAGEKKLKPEYFLRPVEKLFADHFEKFKDKPQTQPQQELFKYLGKGLLEQIRNMSDSQLI